MSFRCEECNIVQPDRTKPKRVVTKIRNKVYSIRKNSAEEVIDRGGKGWEVLQEKDVCDKCFWKITSLPE
jgi:hypothetical protein